MVMRIALLELSMNDEFGIKNQDDTIPHKIEKYLIDTQIDRT